jgi:hypothetical protein
MKNGDRETLIDALKGFDVADYPGALSHQIIDIGDGRFQTTVVWENEGALVAARPDLVRFLDNYRHLLDEISSDLGVTDPISGQIIEE